MSDAQVTVQPGVCECPAPLPGIVLALYTGPMAEPNDGMFVCDGCKKVRRGDKE